MSLARAFTTRRVRHNLELKDSNAADSSMPRRSRTLKGSFGGGVGSIRNKISAPVELTHTTNMLSYNAPDIRSQTATALTVGPPPLEQRSPSSSVKSSSGKSSSDDESDSGYTAASTPPTSPDSPFPSSGGRSMSPEPNHLSCYFTPPTSNTTSVAGSIPGTNSPAASAAAAVPAPDAPAIPQRAPSHTKKSYDGLGRHRSTSRVSDHSARSLSSKASFSFSRSSSTSTHTSVASISHPASAPHHVAKPLFAAPTSVPTAPPVSHKKEYSESNPFGHELAKVSELVEEFGKEAIPEAKPARAQHHAVRSPYAEEEKELARQGLQKFSAEDYLSEIQGLVSSFLADARPMAAPVWI